MNPTSRLLALLALVVLPALNAGCASPGHDLYLFGAVNIQGRVAGSRDSSLNGVYLRQADGTFRHIGINYPAMLAGSFDPRDPRVFYVATINGVLFTRDGGQTWRIGTSWDMTEPKTVMVDPNAPDTVYAALPDGLGVSTDRGMTWTRRENGLPARGKYTQAIKVDRTQAGRVLAACEIGIYLTEDGANNWRQVLATKETVTDIQQSPHDPAVWLAATQSAGAFISRDRGVTWQNLPGVPSDRALYNITFDVTNPQRFAIGSWAHGVLTSEDGGATWTARNAGLPEGHCVWRVGVDPEGRLYASVVKETLYVSDDFGRTWRRDALEGSLVNSFLLLPRAAK